MDQVQENRDVLARIADEAHDGECADSVLTAVCRELMVTRERVARLEARSFDLPRIQDVAA